MDTGKRRDLPASLEQTRRRFQQWRETRKPHARIPDSLWTAAIRMAGRHGISKAANTLGVNYQRLKKRLAAGSCAGKGRIGRKAGDGLGTEATARFVELPGAIARMAVAAPCECFVELENGRGARMRVHLKTAAAPDLAALSRSFWNPRP